MSAVVEFYDSEKHGYCDDCDFVITCKNCADDITLVDDFVLHSGRYYHFNHMADYGDEVLFYLCHS
jgi:hypothetical protein